MVGQLCKGVLPCQPYAVVTDVQSRYPFRQVGIKVVKLFAFLGEALHLKPAAHCLATLLRAAASAVLK